MMLQLRCRPAEFNPAPPDVSAFLTAARTAPADVADPLLWIPAPIAARPGLPVPLEQLPPPVPTYRVAGASMHRFAALALAGGLAVAPAAAHAEEEDEAAEVESDDGAEEAPPPAPDVIVVPPPVEGPHPLSYEGDELWKAVRGARVEVTLKGGKVLVGTVLAQAGDEFAMAREPDGTVARVPKHMVRRLRVLGMEAGAEAPREVMKRPPKGDGPAIAGAILTIMGTSFMTTSAVISFAGGYYYGLPLFFFGSSMLGPGIPLLATGIDQQVKYQAWERKNDFRLGLGAGPKGFGASFSFKF